MNPDHASYAAWDAAYVLGALSPSDRRAYEGHLEQCGLCRAAISEIAPTLGLLSRVAPEDGTRHELELGHVREAERQSACYRCRPH